MTELNYKFIAEKQEQEIKELKLVSKVQDILYQALSDNFDALAKTSWAAVEEIRELSQRNADLEEDVIDAQHALGMLQERVRQQTQELEESLRMSHMYRVKYQKAAAERGWWAKFKDFLQKPVKG